MGTWSINNGASITQNGLVTIPSSSTAKDYTVTYTNGSCTCTHVITQSAQPVGCTFTVKSNVEGATVHWEGGHTTTIIGGKSTITSPDAQYLRVITIEKDGCVFSQTSGRINCNGSITLNGYCSGPSPEYCTYTVYSNVNGASVSWSNGDRGTIVGGSHSTTASSGSYTATLSKDGCTFSNNGALCYCDSSVRITGSCDSPTPGCSDATVTISGLESGVNAQVNINGESNYWSNGSYTYSFPSGTNSVPINFYKSDCSFSPSSGTLTCGGNFSTTASCGGGGGGCDCSLAESSASFTSAGGSKTITVNGASSCSGWQATSSKSWCTPDYRSGELTITVGEYTDTTTDRSATVTLKTDSGNVTCGTVSVTQSKKSGSCTISYTSTGKTGHASFSYGGSTKTSSSGSFTASGTGGTITASADSGYYVDPSSNNVPCGGSKRFDIYKNTACTVYGGNTGSSVSVDFHPNSAPDASIAFSVDYENTSGEKHTYTEYGRTISAGQSSFTVTIPSSYHPKSIKDKTFKIVSKSFASSGGQSTIDSSTYTRFYF